MLVSNAILDIDITEQLSIKSDDFDGDFEPMEEDFKSARNSYKIDIDDPGIATVGCSK